MIHSKYTKAILNALFHTTGSSGVTAEEEQAMLEENGIPMGGISASFYGLAYSQDGFSETGETTRNLNEKKEMVNATTWFYTQNTEFQTFEFEDEDGKTFSKSFRGWTIEKRTEQRFYYPSSAFLALFNTMPDENGQNYVEPVNGSNGTRTTYIRVNLKEGIITGNVSLNDAVADTENGGSILDNGEMIMFPEIVGSTWGTIVGFGVFEGEEVETGDTPIFWGRLTGGSIASSANHVPLFRVGDFKITLQ